jgi:hypothetical protein
MSMPKALAYAATLDKFIRYYKLDVESKEPRIQRRVTQGREESILNKVFSILTS